MSRSLPWDDIRVPTSDYNVRLVSNGGVIPAYWGRDTAGNWLLLINLEGDHSRLFAEGRTAVRGISVDLQANVASGSQNLVLTLERQIDGDLFCSLCDSLVESIRPIGRPDAALSVALSHIRRWKAFLSGRNARLLSAEEIRGLFSELSFLRQLYDKKLDRASAVSAWTGADQVHQDFVFGGCAVEVKSLLGTDRNTIRISSEDQLDTVQDSLFLVTYRLREGREGQKACSLNELVRLMEHEIVDADALEEFARKLGAYGYAPLQEYDKPKLLVASTDAYDVKDGFPRIVRSGLPAGVSRVKYQIDIEQIAPFRCTIEKLLEQI